MEEEIIRYRADGNVILAGDLNAKTGTERDYVADQMDDHSPINNIETYVIDDPTTRYNQDKHPVDIHGEKLLNLCKNTQMRILNGRTIGDRMGKFTRHPLAQRESPSTLDYMIADIETLKNIKYFTVLPHLGLSDHECLSVLLKTGGFRVDDSKVNIHKETPLKYASTGEFLLKLTSPLTRLKLHRFMEVYSNPSLGGSLENMSTYLIHILYSASTG